MTYKDTFAYGGKKFDHLFLELKANRIGEPFYMMHQMVLCLKRKQLIGLKKNI